MKMTKQEKQQFVNELSVLHYRRTDISIGINKYESKKDVVEKIIFCSLCVLLFFSLLFVCSLAEQKTNLALVFAFLNGISAFIISFGYTYYVESSTFINKWKTERHSVRKLISKKEDEIVEELEKNENTNLS